MLRFSKSSRNLSIRGGGIRSESMDWQSRRWMVLLTTVWIQAFTGTNFDFSAYSTELKVAMEISQVQLNYLAVASDLGKALGWSSGLALLYLPIPAVLFLAATIGFLAYGAQWLLITSRIALPYALVFLMCLLAGLSICCFNTVCFVLCIRNFSAHRSLALSLTVSFNGISAALYTLAAKSIDGSPSSYLLLNAVLPAVTSIAALFPILRQPPVPSSSRRWDNQNFLLLYTIAFLTGAYLLLLSPTSPKPSTSRLFLAGALVLIAIPLVIPGIVVAREWAFRSIHSSPMEDADDQLDIHKKLIASDGELDEMQALVIRPDEKGNMGYQCWYNDLIGKDLLILIGEEHCAKSLIRRLDFWIYYFSYFCGGTLGLVYSNNLGQIAQSLGRQSQAAALVNVYSSCSFFGRLVSAAPDFLAGRVRLARTGWMAAALVPMPAAFFFLAAEAENRIALFVGTAVVGLCSGFVFAGAVSVTSELFGPASFGVNHNIVITNIPLGSLLYGLLAALVYDANGGNMRAVVQDGAVVCMGQRCYSRTFTTWGAISMFGLASASLLYLRTRPAYNRASAMQTR